MKVDPNKVIKTKPKMIKQGYGIADFFCNCLAYSFLDSTCYTGLPKHQREMKTAIQELIEYLTEQLDKVVKEHPIEVNKDTYWRGVKIGLETTIALAESLLNKEKEQIGRAYQEGLLDGLNHTPKDYYNETFKPNEK